MDIKQAIKLIEEEYHESNRKHPKPYHSYHEAIGLLEEEFSELKAEIFRKEAEQNPRKIAHEAKHVANVALKTMMMAMKEAERMAGKKQ